MPSKFSLTNVIFLLALTFIGLVTGFALGVSWATDQALSIDDKTAKTTLEKVQAQLIEKKSDLQSAQGQITQLIQQIKNYQTQQTTNTEIQSPTQPIRPSPTPIRYYTGEDLLQAVNKYRREHGVPELQLHSGLCQLSSFRLNQLIDLGKLDNHAGFEQYFNDHKISELSGPSLTNVAENLAKGYPTAQETVQGWDNSPPHRTFLLADGAYKYGCASANQYFAVLIGGY